MEFDTWDPSLVSKTNNLAEVEENDATNGSPACNDYAHRVILWALNHFMKDTDITVVKENNSEDSSQ